MSRIRVTWGFHFKVTQPWIEGADQELYDWLIIIEGSNREAVYKWADKYEIEFYYDDINYRIFEFDVPEDNEETIALFTLMFKS